MPSNNIRELLSSPTSSPTFPAYTIANGLSSGPNSFPGALAEVNRLKQISNMTDNHKITIDPQANNLVCSLGYNLISNLTFTIDLMGQNFTVNNGRIDSYGMDSSGFTINSSNGKGNIAFNIGFRSYKSPFMNVLIDKNVAVSVTGSDITNFYQSDTSIIVKESSTLILKKSSLSSNRYDFNGTLKSAKLNILSGAKIALDQGAVIAEIDTVIEPGGVFEVSSVTQLYN